MRVLITYIFSFLVFISCKVDEPQNSPVVITNKPSEIKLTSAIVSGEVTNEGFSAATERGIVLSETNKKPSVSDTKFTIGYGIGAFSKALENLKVNTNYNYAAFATNSKGTSYGEIMSFTTADYTLATLSIEPSKNITSSTVQLTGLVSNDGGISVSERGFVLSTSTNPTVNNIKISNGKGLGAFSSVVTQLNDETTYFAKAFSINGKGISYSNEISFKTLGSKIPTVKTDLPINLTFYSAVLGGEIIDNGNSDIIESGICFGFNPIPTYTDNLAQSTITSGNFRLLIPDLKSNFVYYFRAFAKNAKGVGYGEVKEVKLLSPLKETLVIEVKSKTGRVWMDRNLGAQQVAISTDDKNAFGDWYQWGRGSDGHQNRNSPETTILSETDNPSNYYFIINKIGTDWRRTKNNSLWQGVNGINNPCPSGFRIPTEEEWKIEMNTWISKDIFGAFASPLKLTHAGYRFPAGGSGYTETTGFYATSTPSYGNFQDGAQVLIVDKRESWFGSQYRADGRTVRCIKN
mgnify:CR=1 FL=1